MVLLKRVDNGHPDLAPKTGKLICMQHHGRLFLSRFQSRIDATGQSMEERDIGQRGQQTSRQHDRFSSNPVGEPTEEKEQWERNQQRNPDEIVSNLIIKLQNAGQKE